LILDLVSHFPGATEHQEEHEQNQQSSTEFPSEDKWNLARQIVDKSSVSWAIKSFQPFHSGQIPYKRVDKNIFWSVFDDFLLK
jgi:hypothetical protein